MEKRVLYIYIFLFLFQKPMNSLTEKTNYSAPIIDNPVLDQYVEHVKSSINYCYGNTFETTIGLLAASNVLLFPVICSKSVSRSYTICLRLKR